MERRPGDKGCQNTLEITETKIRNTSETMLDTLDKWQLKPTLYSVSAMEVQRRRNILNDLLNTFASQGGEDKYSA